MINYWPKASNLKLEVKVISTYVIFFIVVFVVSALFGNDTWSSTVAAIIATIALVSALFLLVLTATTLSLAIIGGLKLMVITLIAMFAGVGTGILCKTPE
jgi:hypothetical protein